MISQEHLEHWLKEISWQLNGIINEVATKKVGQTGLKLKNGNYVSFEYLLEKAQTIAGTLGCIEHDIEHDEEVKTNGT